MGIDNAHIELLALSVEYLGVFLGMQADNEDCKVRGFRPAYLGSTFEKQVLEFQKEKSKILNK